MARDSLFEPPLQLQSLFCFIHTNFVSITPVNAKKPERFWRSGLVDGGGDCKITWSVLQSRQQ